jgi:RNA polymerase sigma-70 factor, ECF subfamily
MIESSSFLPGADDCNCLSVRFNLIRPYLLALTNRELPPYSLKGCSGSDLIQETFLIAHQKWKQFRGATNDDLKKWLSAILRYQIMHLRRKARATSTLSLSESVAEGICDKSTPAIQLELKEELFRLLRLVQDMPELQQQIIEGRIEREESFRELGQKLGMSEDATRKAFHRAINQLKGYFIASSWLARADRRDSS